jgi:hypothetical protein
MTDRAFIIQQVGFKDSSERKRADEIYNFIVVPAVQDAGLEPYRADLDMSPGAITTRMLSELLSARIVIADLTGRNPNVFYELGITHSFARPVISIADSSRSLPFDTKDERVIELGEYPSSGLTYAQGEQAKASLQQTLRIVLSDNYIPPSPLREVAANQSVDELAPDNPIAAELAQMRETLDEIRKRVTLRPVARGVTQRTVDALRKVIERNFVHLNEADFTILLRESLTEAQNEWAKELQEEWLKYREAADPWAKEPTLDEPPF